VDISADGAFNLDYRIRVLDVLERESILAFNLSMNKDGTFSKKRKSGNKHSLCSYMVAKHVIQKFYLEQKKHSL
jgi:hypothetical protein